MKEKLKRHSREFIKDKRVQGILIGGAVGITSVIVTAKRYNLSFGDQTKILFIPDGIIDSIRETGLPVMITRTDGVQLMIGPS